MHDKIRNILFVSLFISLEIILTRFLSIESPIVRISFEFIPIAISAILFGPVTAGGAAAIADVLGMLIFPKGPYFPGFTLSAFISGYLYGLILYKKKITLVRTFVAALAVNLIAGLVLNTIWLIYLTHDGAYVILAARAIKCLVFLPIQTFMVYYIWKYTRPIINGTMSTKQIS
ncbi:MAG TPA: folate family ECF transporter S component [Ruminiclostridium sp.]